MRGHIADRTVKTREVVVLDERFNRSVRIVLAQQYARSNAILFDRLMEAFDLAITLWVVRTRANMAHARDPNKLFEVSRYELLAVVRDDSWPRLGMLFARFLKNDFDVCLFHRLTNFAVNNESATAVKDRAQVIERSANIDVCQVHVPVIVWSDWLCESVAFGCLLCVPSI